MVEEFPAGRGIFATTLNLFAFSRCVPTKPSNDSDIKKFTTTIQKVSANVIENLSPSLPWALSCNSRRGILSLFQAQTCHMTFKI
jgi:hypothetical protein